MSGPGSKEDPLKILRSKLLQSSEGVDYLRAWEQQIESLERVASSLRYPNRGWPGELENCRRLYIRASNNCTKALARVPHHEVLLG